MALATVEQAAGLVTPEQVADLRAYEASVDLARSTAIEAEIHHDLMAEIRCFAEQCAVGGGIVHLGATSADIEDNADALRLGEWLDLLLAGLRRLLEALTAQIERYADLTCMGYTHLQPAEPTTVGYRLAGYAQDLLAAWEDLRRARTSIRGKGLKGAVGTSASYSQLLAGTSISPMDLEAAVMADLGLAAWEAMRLGQANPLAEWLSADERITRWLAAERVLAVLHAEDYVGDAPARARALAGQVRASLKG